MAARPPVHASRRARKFEQDLRAFCLEYPDAHEDMPWGHRAMKVRKKAFVFMGLNETGLFVCMKLPRSNVVALDHEFTEPTGYGLGKSGWVTAQFGMQDDVPIDLIEDWIDESYRTIAPKTLVKQLDGEPAPPPKKARKKTQAKKTTRKKSSR